jgi:WD40 repeat protein
LTDPNAPATDSLEVGPDGTRMLIGRREEAALWKMEAGDPKLVADLRHEGGTITAARFSPDGTMIVTAGTDNRARTWDARTGAPIVSVQHQGEVSSAEFSADSTRIVTGSADRTARVWQARTGAPVGDPLTHPDGVKAAHLDGRGARVLTVAGDGVARLWDLDAGTTVTIRYSQPIVSAGFGRGDETVMTLAYDGTPRLWEAGTGHLIAALADAPSLACEFSPDGQRLVTSSRDAFRIWDARTGEPRTQAIRHDGGAATARFSPDGQRVVTAAEDGTVRIWNVPVGSREDSHTMASLLEAVVGYGVNDGGSLVPVGDRAAALRDRRDHRPPAAAGLGERVGAWVLADRQRRTISPFTNVTIEEYVRQQLETHDEDARLEARRRFPWDARSLPSPAVPTPSETAAPSRESPGAGPAPTGGRRRSNVH